MRTWVVRVYSQWVYHHIGDMVWGPFHGGSAFWIGVAVQWYGESQGASQYSITHNSHVDISYFSPSPSLASFSLERAALHSSSLTTQGRKDSKGGKKEGRREGRRECKEWRGEKGRKRERENMK